MSADKLHVKAAQKLPLVGLAKPKQDLYKLPRTASGLTCTAPDADIAKCAGAN